MEDIGRDIEDLARELVWLATITDDTVMSLRLAEMAEEVLALAGPQTADSQVYHSATLFLHTGAPGAGKDADADVRSIDPTQRH